MATEAEIQKLESNEIWDGEFLENFFNRNVYSIRYNEIKKKVF